jgi:ABC-type uncharacterized transport system involved in gliding motility auxiliary subunit
MAGMPAWRGKKASGAGALVALALLFIGLTILFTFLLRGARIDLTESRLYSLAPGTERIVGTLEEPINLYFFFSQAASADTPQLRAYAQRVRELLEEMAGRSKGKIRLSVIDPQPFSEDEDRATEFGLTAVPLGARGDTLYFGLAGTNSTDGREVIGFFQPDKEEFLEYDVASLIHRLGNPKKPVVGVLAGLPVDASFDEMSGQMREGWASIAQLRELVDVETVTPDVAEIDAKVDVLLVIHPKNLTPKALYAVDQFVMRGGKLIAFVDPKADSDPMSRMGGPMDMGGSASSLAPLLDRWGIEFDTSQVLGDRGLGLTVAMTAGVLSKKDGAAIEFEPLLQSSADAELLPAARLAFLPDSRALLDDFKPTGKRYALGARVLGKLKSAYPGGPPPPAAANAGHLTESKGDANLIVVADSDMLANPLWLRNQSVFGQQFTVAWANNGDFLANAVENLAGSSDLISIRGRQSFFRPFTRVDALRRQADERLRAKEQELDRELQDTEKKLSELESARSDNRSLMLSPEQKSEIERFQEERVRIRRELRDVRRGLDVEIERLGTVLKAVNIALVPLLLAVGAIVLAVLRRRRLRAGRAAAHAG